MSKAAGRADDIAHHVLPCVADPHVEVDGAVRHSGMVDDRTAEVVLDVRDDGDPRQTSGSLLALASAVSAAPVTSQTFPLRSMRSSCLQPGATKVALAGQVISARPSPLRHIHSTIAWIEQAAGEALPIVSDTRNEPAVAAAVESTVKRFGSAGVDVVINNGVQQAAARSRTADVVADAAIAIHTRSAHRCSEVPLTRFGASRRS